MLLLVVHHLQELAKGNYVCESAEAQDVEECVGALQRSASRTDEDVAPFLPAQKRAYVFGGMAAAAARFAMWLLPELKVESVSCLKRLAATVTQRSHENAQACMSCFIACLIKKKRKLLFLKRTLEILGAWNIGTRHAQCTQEASIRVSLAGDEPGRLGKDVQDAGCAATVLGRPGSDDELVQT